MVKLAPLTPEEHRELLDSSKFRHLVICEYGPWRLYLAADQRYLGRAYAWLAARHEDFHRLEDLYTEESEKLQDLMARYSAAVKTLWGSDFVNYAWLGNEFHLHRGHGHMHLIPRYEAAPEFGGRAFPDYRFGKNYAPYEKYEPPEELLFAIRDALKAKIGLG
ncbi:MAG TPA: hypothetical protein VEB18_01215 [Candidatus Paceibacterota bacterium]|nr:hypothetical protein [Candidatus Paceibacterota bacterium]